MSGCNQEKKYSPILHIVSNLRCYNNKSVFPRFILKYKMQKVEISNESPMIDIWRNDDIFSLHTVLTHLITVNI